MAKILIMTIQVNLVLNPIGEGHTNSPELKFLLPSQSFLGRHLDFTSFSPWEPHPFFTAWHRYEILFNANCNLCKVKFLLGGPNEIFIAFL